MATDGLVINLTSMAACINLVLLIIKCIVFLGLTTNNMNNMNNMNMNNNMNMKTEDFCIDLS
jgi:hypothetical protein